MMKAAHRVLDRSVAGHGACVLWTGTKTPTGYGQINFGGRRLAVHRVSYVAFKGTIPDGLEIDHLCRVRHCVNPHHLEAVTHAENLRRAVPRSLKTHCKHGHEYTPENSYVPPRGKRECWTCKRATKKGSGQAAKGQPDQRRASGGWPWLTALPTCRA